MQTEAMSGSSSASCLCSHQTYWPRPALPLLAARLGSAAATHQGFLDDVTVPIIESLFTAVLRRLGPRITGVGPPECRCTPEQQEVIHEIEEIGKLFARKDPAFWCMPFLLFFFSMFVSS